MVDIVKCFLEVYKCNVCILSEGFADVADVIERVDVVSTRAVGTESILFITDFVFFF